MEGGTARLFDIQLPQRGHPKDREGVLITYVRKELGVRRNEGERQGRQ